MKRKRIIEDPVAGVRLLRKAQVCDLLGVSSWTIDHWIQQGRFPKPIFITPGSPARFRLIEVQRFIDASARKRRKPIRRGKLRQGSGRNE